MSDQFQPMASEQLFRWVFSELAARDSIFGIPRKHFFVPSARDPFRTSAFGHPLETPFGPAAGPHSQMAQNIVAAWLCGARYIELKTVQTIDELNVSKPCIDMEDEGYNVEWSQELKIHQSFDEYLRAWVLIHALHHKLGFPGPSPGMVFNLSVGYNLEGIQKPNMQWFLNQMADSSEYKSRLIEHLAHFYPAVNELEIPDCLSDNVTLSTMHGCPPDEIESICRYLLKQRRLHTFVKCNPTLLGPERVRSILHDDLHYTDVVVPDAAFAHDLAFSDALPLLQNLRGVASDCGLDFGVKLSNTLEVQNFRTVFQSREKMMYLSGRPLHAITVNLASMLADEFSGELPMSFSAGADCFNAPQLLGAGMQTITTCSDLLKTGGYLRLLQYLESTALAFSEMGASSIEEFILKTTRAEATPADRLDSTEGSARQNLRRYAAECIQNRKLKKGAFFTSRSKTSRKLGLFDCIEAPCVDQCPVDQNVPQYMQAVREGNDARALQLTRTDNPIPAILGRVCDHLCEPVCIRSHLDEPLAIRHIKRFILEQEDIGAVPERPPLIDLKVAIIGAGPGGMAAALELARAGCEVAIHEMHAYPGGMVGGAIPHYRLPQNVIDQDLHLLESLGVKIHYNSRAGRDIHLSQLRQAGFEHVVIMAGAQLGKKLGLAGEDCAGVIDALDFLRQAREGYPIDIGQRVGIIGAGDTAMDCARTAWRQSQGKVSVIYRRSIDQMPADREEVKCLLEEGIAVTEMASPQALVVENGQLRALVCRGMEFSGERDSGGRKIPRELADSDFEVPLDTLILAISQHAILDFFEQEPIALNDKGYIAADPISLETSVPGVYAGGDVVNDGPSSIVEAAADGKAIAASILRQGELSKPARVQAFDTTLLQRRRSQRQWRVPVPHSALEKRKNFAEVVRSYTEQQARQEASRCLDCDQYCSLCVGVCPNMALQTFEIEPFEKQLPTLRIENGKFRLEPGSKFQVSQAFQIALLADLCNECGNCTTFCPTSGEPYRDKPRLYLDQKEFEEQTNNAFLVYKDAGQWAMQARFEATTHHIKLDETLEYETPLFRARIDPLEFKVEWLEAKEGARSNERLSLEPCATMFVMLKAFRQTMEHLPTAWPARQADSGRITEPAFEE